MKEVNNAKNELQKQAHSIWLSSRRVGTVVAGTGFGKSRIAVLEVERMAQTNDLMFDEKTILLVTPTIKLKDENWPKEFENWGAKTLFNEYVETVCFASLRKLKEQGKQWKLVILDEVHRLTQLSAEFFETDGEDVLADFLDNANCDAVLGLTATVPDKHREPEKLRLLAKIAPIVFTYSLDQGVQDGMIRDYEIRIIQHRLNSTDKYITAGSKAKPFMTTEKAHYEYLEKQMVKYRIAASTSKIPKDAASLENLAALKTFERNRFLASLKSKTQLAKMCIDKMNNGVKRILVFTGSIEQCNELLGANVYHSKSTNTAYEAFNRKEINILGAVKAIDEGVNIVDLDQSLIVSYDSSSRRLVQRIGRNLRHGLDGKALIYILCTMDTAEEKWLETILEAFDRNKIKYYSSKSITAQTA